jgi:hypothetical protein
MHREKPHKLLQVGVTPTPATSLRSHRSKSEGCRAETRSTRAGRTSKQAGYGSAS